MKDKTEAVKLLLNNGWRTEEVEGLFERHNQSITVDLPLRFNDETADRAFQVNLFRESIDKQIRDVIARETRAGGSLRR